MASLYKKEGAAYRWREFKQKTTQSTLGGMSNGGWRYCPEAGFFQITEAQNVIQIQS